MVNFCSAFNCASSSDVRKDLSFHKFPLKDKERLQKWVHAVRRKDFKPSSNTTLCSLHFNETDFYSAVVSGKKMLIKSAVPTIFNFPNHLTPKIKERRILQREDTTTTIAVQNNENMSSTCKTETKFVDVGIQTKLTGEEFEKTLNDLRRDKRILQQKLSRRDKRVSNMCAMLNLLKDNHLIGDTVEDIFKNQFDSSLPFALFKNEIANVNNASNHKLYSEEIREFCLTLHFYSPRAYEFIRQRSTLPDPSTIRRWLATKHCNPGILHEVIDYFKHKLKSETSKFSHVKDVALIYDAMSIREGFWPDKSGKVYGYCDLGGIAHTDNEELAKEALVFIISSLNIKFKCPVAYFFINKINATVQSQLVLAVISVLYEAGITVRSLTSDGTTTNLKTYEILGCSLDHANIQSSFPHPNEPLINIYCIVDPCHLMKICRNCMAELSLSHSGNKISFDYVKKLHEIQQIENLKFANKLSSLHIFYKNKKMSVPLAVQVLSSSVADALQFLQSNNNDFKDATATIEFIRIFDRLFDIMNARNSFGKGFKSPIKLSNRFVWEEIFESAKSYILQLKCEEKDILQHRRKTFALGFLINILSYKNLALDLLTRENEPLLYFLPYKTSQDHAEITFSCIRSAGGWNNNPSALQFKWIIRKMLYRNSVLPSKNANCQDLEDKNESISIGIFSLSHEKSFNVDKKFIIEESIDEEEKYLAEVNST